MISEFDNFIFDLDGTLVDTAPRILECLKEALTENGLHSAANQCTSALIGPPLEIMLKTLVPSLNDNEINIIITKFRKKYVENPFLNTKAYSDSVPLLAKLSSLGKRLFLATNKPFEPTKKIIEHHFSTKFEALLTSDYNKSSKLSKSEMLEYIVTEYNLDKVKTLFIGDTLGDLQASRRTQIPFALVLFGYAPDIELLKVQSDFCIHNYKELL